MDKPPHGQPYMTVRELIEALSKFNPDDPVMIICENGHYNDFYDGPLASVETGLVKKFQDVMDRTWWDVARVEPPWNLIHTGENMMRCVVLVPPCL